MELGFGSNTTVANWIFNNPLEEENEEDDVSASHIFRIFHFAGPGVSGIDNLPLE